MLDKKYPIPEPKEEPVKALVIVYKVEKGVEYDDRDWDKIHFARCMKAANDLFKSLGSFRSGAECIKELGGEFEKQGITWKLETILNHCHDWKKKKEATRGNGGRKRFFDDLIKQRADTKNPGEGIVSAGGKDFNALGDFSVLSDGEEGAQPRSLASHGKPMGEVQGPMVEESPARKFGVV